eukprot:1111709_1
MLLLPLIPLQIQAPVLLQIQQYPTIHPTWYPSQVPTHNPTINPSSNPTKGPTIHTSSPTAQPSAVPTAWEDCVDETIQLSGAYMQILIKTSAQSREMEIQLTAPKHSWFGVGFGADRMNQTLAITVASVGGTIAVRSRRLQHHSQGDITSDALDNIQPTEFASNRQVTILNSWA